MTAPDTGAPSGATTPVLDRLVGDGGGFLRTTFGTTPLHVPAGSPDTFENLLSVADIDRLVTDGGLRAPAFRLIKDGATLPRSVVTRRARIGSRPVDDLVDAAAVHAAFADGASVVLQGLHRSWSAVAALCRALEDELTHPVQANAYLTPPVAQGLDLHTDAHDVFVLQTEGDKRWVVHPPHGAPVWDLTVRSGDVLYLPAGTPHAAQTLDRPSLHLTIGIRTVRWRSLAQAVVDRALDDSDLASASLPGGWARSPTALRDGLALELERLAGTLRTDDLDDVLVGEAQRFFASRTPERTGGLRDVLALAELDDDTALSVRPTWRARLEDGGDGVVLVLPDRRVRFPADLRDALTVLLASDPVRPSDLAGHLDADGRLVLCRRLVREGLLTVVAAPAGSGP